jgi:hypothetical protein
LSNREHLIGEERVKLRVVSAKPKPTDVRKTPEMPDQRNSHNVLPDASRSIDQDTGKKTAKKLELSNRHRRSFSDGNDHAAQFKFM